MTDLQLIDKTLQIAVRKRIAGKRLEALRDVLIQLKLLQFDLDVTDWECYLKHERIAIDLQHARGCIPAEGTAVQLAHQLGFYHIRMDYVYRPDQASLIALRVALATAVRLQLVVDWHIVNLSELQWSEVLMLLSVLEEFPVHGLVCGDRIGCLEPLSTRGLVGKIHDRVACELEFEGKNDLGLAVGNTLGAVLAGSLKLVVAVGGLDGWAAYEEVLLGLNNLLHLPIELPCLLAQQCQAIFDFMGLKVPETKPIIGKNAFAHESGIHVNGVNKCPELYEAFRPETVGVSRQIVIGKHSGSSAIRQQLEVLGIHTDDQTIEQVLVRVRHQAVRQKSSLSLQQLQEIYDEVCHECQNS